MKDSKTESITFRTTKELKDALQMMADKENRTLSNMIELLLEKAISTSSKKK
jgi:antitoxin component of RelBE/YafQ-DinJ toxin-antitoxin module